MAAHGRRVAAIARRGFPYEAALAAAGQARRPRPAPPRHEFVPNPEQAKKEMRGRPLAGTSDERLNRALALLCSLQVQGASPRR